MYCLPSPVPCQMLQGEQDGFAMGDSLNPNTTAQGLWEQIHFRGWLYSGLKENENILQLLTASPKNTCYNKTNSCMRIPSKQKSLQHIKQKNIYN